MDDVVQALMIAFGALLFVIGFSVAMYMFSQVTTTAETLALYADSTLYYDNIKVADSQQNSASRNVNSDTIIPTLYRYYKERFAVQIYNTNNELIQIFDLDLESKVEGSINHTDDSPNSEKRELRDSYAYRNTYNDSNKTYYMFGASWLGDNENIKKRIDLFIRGESGYIGGQYVNYSNDKYNDFHEAIINKDIEFEETFINYAISGDTWTSEDGDTTLVNGEAPKDKIVIIYKQLEN